jgi:hypothetical protein
MSEYIANVNVKGGSDSDLPSNHCKKSGFAHAGAFFGGIIVPSGVAARRA